MVRAVTIIIDNNHLTQLFIRIAFISDKCQNLIWRLLATPYHSPIAVLLVSIIYHYEPLALSIKNIYKIPFSSVFCAIFVQGLNCVLLVSICQITSHNRIHYITETIIVSIKTIQNPLYPLNPLYFLLLFSAATFTSNSYTYST